MRLLTNLTQPKKKTIITEMRGVCGLSRPRSRNKMNVLACLLKG